MSNKGTQALFISDVNVVNSLLGSDSYVSVSTTDIEGVQRLGLSLNSVLPPMVDLPYERVDQLVRKFGVSRNSIQYKCFALAMLIYMFLQILFSALSITLSKLGMKAFYRAEVLSCLKDCDLVVSHSDESFKETASLLPPNPYWVVTWWSMLIARTWEILFAKSLKKPVVLFPNSVGPFRTWLGRSLSRISLGYCDYVLIRDPVSYNIVNRLGIKSRRMLTFDTALLFSSPSSPIDDPCVGMPKPLLGVSPGMYSGSLSGGEFNNYIRAHAESLDYAVEKHGFFVALLPHYISGFQNDDLHVCRLILEKMRSKNQVMIFDTRHVTEFKLLLDQMDLIISSKMHPAVLAASGFVPILCIAYDHKQQSFLERLGMSDCIIPISQVSSENLSSKIDYVWNRKNQLKNSLKNQVPIWQRETKETISYVVSVFVDGKRFTP